MVSAVFERAENFTLYRAWRNITEKDQCLSRTTHETSPLLINT
ncbi:hypothetical protein BN1221_02139c [Brenneria goodwinii]|uniref:Uncharacterized protein n=1 Tax=Brenneria goodwinii TaxID=1109412 RepID=A0A0G4JUV4_9GAMM|nr:hypothetical protein BN1221_02139c [Brenneria goodwinii]